MLANAISSNDAGRRDRLERNFEKAWIRRSRSEARAQIKSMCRAKVGAWTGSFRSESPSGHGGGQSWTSATPNFRSTIVAIAGLESISNRSCGRMPARLYLLKKLF
jgi:hypothetical protein